MVNHNIYPDLCEKETNISISEHNLQIQLAQYTHDNAYQRRLPLDQWHPKDSGQMDLCIHANGEWWHEGQQIQRERLIDLFSRLLCQENGQTYLKTPQEKWQIQVEDAPLFVNRIERITLAEDQTVIYLWTTDHDYVVLDQDHAPFMQTYQSETRPYVYIRYGLYALIQRSAFYHLIEEGELVENHAGETILSVQSGDFCLHLHA